MTTTTNNNLVEMTAIVADIIGDDGNANWLMVSLCISESAITITYGARSHKYGSNMRPSSFKHFSLIDTSWSTITRCLYDALSMDAMLKAARNAINDNEAYLITLDGDKVLKQAFIAWRDALRDGAPFSSTIETIKDSR